MPKIRSSADLRNNYNDISTFCHTYAEPVFITKNGKGDLAVMRTSLILKSRFSCEILWLFDNSIKVPLCTLM